MLSAFVFPQESSLLAEKRNNPRPARERLRSGNVGFHANSIRWWGQLAASSSVWQDFLAGWKVPRRGLWSPISGQHPALYTRRDRHRPACPAWSGGRLAKTATGFPISPARCRLRRRRQRAGEIVRVNRALSSLTTAPCGASPQVAFCCLQPCQKILPHTLQPLPLSGN